MRRLARSSALALLLAVPAAAEAQVRVRPPRGLDRERQAEQVLEVLGAEHLLREAWRVTTRRFYDADALPEDWEAVRARYLEEVGGAPTPEAAHAVINDMLGELETSHLALMERRVFLRELYNEFRGEPVLRAGCELLRVDGRLFVRAVSEGGPAAEAGLRTGDEVVRVEGAAPTESGLLDPAGHDPGLPDHRPGYYLRVDDRSPIEVAVRREAEGSVRTRTIQPRPTSLIEASRRSARVVDVDGTRVGVIHLWHYITPATVRVLRDALEGPLAEAEALVLDVRGRGGSTTVVRRVLTIFGGFGAQEAIWDRPVVCLIDRATRSAKEIFAWGWKRRELGPLIGERTAGACIGCTFQQLSDGSILMVPVLDVRRLTGGTSLEDRGVAPTERVEQHPLPYRAGRDAILAAGLERAAELAAPSEGERRAY